MRRASFVLVLLSALYILFRIVIPSDLTSWRPRAGAHGKPDVLKPEASINDATEIVPSSPPIIITAVPRALIFPTATPGSAEDSETIADPARSRAGGAQGVTVGSRDDEESANYYGGNRASAERGGNSRVNSPAIEALIEAGRASESRVFGGAGRGLIPGVPVSRTPGAGSRPTSAPVVIPAPTAAPGLVRVGGQARGYAMLYLMQPRARATVEKQIEILLRAQIDEIFLGVLTDGTFSSGSTAADIEYLSSVVRRLSRVNRSLTLMLYLTNGATMRSWKTTVIEAGFSTVDPFLFRFLIFDDQEIRAKFLSLIRPVIPVLDLNRRLSARNKNLVSVMLEDNLTLDSYVEMRALAQSVIGNRAIFIRNPCPGCLEGNDSESAGDGIELHATDQVRTLGSGDGYTLDGHGYAFPGENTSEVPIALVKDLSEISLSAGLRYFGLWRMARQGIIRADDLEPPDERTYEVPSEEQARIEIELLRHGLFPVGE